jgi:Domain of unknown function (DUF4112)
VPTPDDRELVRVKRIARLMDDAFIDPLLGLFLPGAGDLIGSAIGLYVVGLAARRKVAPIIIARMVLNLAVDAGIGAIPLLGDVFDLAWKANDKNVVLLEQRSATEGKAKVTDWLAVVGAFLALFAVLGLAIWAVMTVLRAIF